MGRKNKKSSKPAGGAKTSAAASWVALVQGLHRASRTGVVRAKGDGELTLHVLGGRLVAGQGSNDDEALLERQRAAGRLGEGQLAWLRAHLGPDDRARDALLTLGLLQPDQLADDQVEALAEAVALPLTWSRCEWSFEARPDVPLDRFDPDLLPLVEPLEALWSGVLRLPTEQLDATAKSGGAYRGDAGLPQLVRHLGLGPAAEALASRLAGASLDVDAAEAAADPQGQALPMLWFAEALGFVARAEGSSLGDLSALRSGWPDGEPTAEAHDG